MGDVEIKLSEKFISQAIFLPQTSEKSYKGKHIKNEQWKGFLTLAHRQTKFKSGFPSRLLMKKWRALLELIIRYVTYEGRLSQTQFYHLRLLSIFKGYPVNMPFFFLNSLHKMASTYQSNVGDKNRILFHHGLIKILVSIRWKN